MHIHARYLTSDMYEFVVEIKILLFVSLLSVNNYNSSYFGLMTLNSEVLKSKTKCFRVTMSIHERM